MESEPEETEDDPWTAEDEAEMQANRRAAEIEFEAEATATFGVPEVRARKNQRYVSRLVRKYGEATIRGILKALSTLQSPSCAAYLAELDLESLPLSKIIQPFELGGLNFRVTAVTEPQFTVDIDAAYGRAGSGGTLLLERVAASTFRVADFLRERTA